MQKCGEPSGMVPCVPDDIEAEAQIIGECITYSLYDFIYIFFFSSRRRHTRCSRDWSSDVCSSDLVYSMFNRWVEDGLLDVLQEEGIGCIAFSPLAQGLLTDKYLKGIPEGSRASKPHGFLRPDQVTDERLAQVRKLNDVAKKRGQTLAQMAIAWVL